MKSNLKENIEIAVYAIGLKATLDLVERCLVEAAMETNGYSQTRAAKDMGINRATLRKKLKKHGML